MFGMRCRESTDPKDIFYAHISSIDALARGLRAAANLKSDGLLEKLRANRYAPWFAGSCHGLANAIRINKVHLLPVRLCFIPCACAAFHADC